MGGNTNASSQESKVKERAAYSGKLMCCFSAWRVIADGELALEMPENNVCDMRGAIEIAETIMPSVWRIVTFEGEKPGTGYRLSLGKWAATPPPR